MFFDAIRQKIYVDNYLELLHKYRIVQKPIYVDYYVFDIQNSIISKDLQGGTYSLLKQTGIKYKLVKNYPLSLFTNYTRSTVGNEGGVYNDVEIECLFVQMDNVKFIPTTEDLVMINFSINEPELQDFNTLFRVVNIETLPILYRKTLYKLKLASSGKLYKDIKNELNCKLSGIYYFDEISKKVYRIEDYNILIESLSKYEEIKNTLNNSTIENFVGIFGNSALKF